MIQLLIDLLVVPRPKRELLAWDGPGPDKWGDVLLRAQKTEEVGQDILEKGTTLSLADPK